MMTGGSMWRPIGAPEPVTLLGAASFELHGTITTAFAIHNALAAPPVLRINDCFERASSVRFAAASVGGRQLLGSSASVSAA